MSQRNDPVKHFFLWPAFLVVLLIAIFPLFYSLINSFMNFRLIPPFPPTFNGGDNYVQLFNNPLFWESARTTSIIVFTSVFFQFWIGFALALALAKRIRGTDFFRTTFLVPMLIAPVAVALIAYQIFDAGRGPMNDLMTVLGFPHLPYLTDSKLAVITLIIVEIWQWTPFVILLLLAGLQGLPRDVYEAAELENVTPWKQFWTITFPMMLPISAAVVFIRIVESYKIMDTVFVMTNGGPGSATQTLTFFAYQEGFKKFNLGYTSATSFMFLIVVLIISLVYLAILKPHLEKYK